MTFNESRFGGAVLIRPAGRIDLSNAEAFKEALLAALASATTAVVVDLGAIDYISSAGLRSMVIALRSAKSASKGFAVSGLTPMVLEIFTISRFNLVFSIHASARDALAAVSPDALIAFDAS